MYASNKVKKECTIKEYHVIGEIYEKKFDYFKKEQIKLGKNVYCFS